MATQKPHRHTTACEKATLVCPNPIHTHDDHCYNFKGRLTCSKFEHAAHLDRCYRVDLVCGQ